MWYSIQEGFPLTVVYLQSLGTRKSKVNQEKSSKKLLYSICCSSITVFGERAMLKIKCDCLLYLLDYVQCEALAFSLLKNMHQTYA